MGSGNYGQRSPKKDWPIEPWKWNEASIIRIWISASSSSSWSSLLPLNHRLYFGWFKKQTAKKKNGTSNYSNEFKLPF